MAGCGVTSLDETAAGIREARNRRNAFREDPILNADDRAYRAVTLLSRREFPDFVGMPRRGRALPPGLNTWEGVMLRAIFEGGEE